MADAMYTGYGIKLHWGPPAKTNDPLKAIGFSERAFKKWQHHLPFGTRMLLYSTRGGGGSGSVHAEVAVAGSFADGASIVPFNVEHPRMLPVHPMHARERVEPVPLRRVREILKDPKWPRQGVSWTPVSNEIYETLRAELLRPSERQAV